MFLWRSQGWWHRRSLATVAVYAGVTFPGVMGVRGYHSPRLIREFRETWAVALFAAVCLEARGLNKPVYHLKVHGFL